jgi:hypothetical protein
MTSIASPRSGNPPSGFPPLDPRRRRGTSLKAAASPSQALIREKPLKPPVAAVASRPTIVTRAESAPCTCPEHCERDHDDE